MLFLLVKHLHLQHHVVLNFAKGQVQSFLARHKKIGWKNNRNFLIGDFPAAEGINQLNGFNFVSEEIDPYSIIGVGQENINGISLDTKRSALEFGLGTVVENVDQAE